MNFDYRKQIPPSLMKKIRKNKQEAIAALRSNCEALGLDWAAFNPQEDALDVARAVTIKRACQACQFSMSDYRQCEYTSQTLPANQWRPYFPICQRHIEHEKESAYCSMYANILSNSGLGKRFLQRRFENFEVTAKTQTVYWACRSFCDNFTKDSKGIRLTGPNGCGKTHLAAAIALQMAEKGVFNRFIVVPELLASMRDNFGQQQQNNSMDTLKQTPLLVLDDLGLGKMSEWAREAIFVLVNRRYENMLPTVITTNFGTSELVERLGQGTVSRLVEMTTAYTMTADDHRLKT